MYSNNIIKVYTVEHSLNKPEIPRQTVCHKQEFVLSEQFPMRYCSTWLRSLLCYIKRIVVEEFVIRVFHCMWNTLITNITCGCMYNYTDPHTHTHVYTHKHANMSTHTEREWAGLSYFLSYTYLHATTTGWLPADCFTFSTDIKYFNRDTRSGLPPSNHCL